MKLLKIFRRIELYEELLTSYYSPVSIQLRCATICYYNEIKLNFLLKDKKWLKEF